MAHSISSALLCANDEGLNLLPRGEVSFRIDSMKRLPLLLMIPLLLGMASSDLKRAGVNPDPNLPRSGLVQVVRDSQTLVLGGDTTVHLIGVSTPQFMEEKAKEFLVRAIHRKTVRLEYDQQPKDIYGNLLAYVYISIEPQDWQTKVLRLPTDRKKKEEKKEFFINEELIKHGLARASLIPPNLLYSKQMALCEKQAKQQRVGIWEKKHLVGKVVEVKYSGKGLDQPSLTHPGLKTKRGSRITFWQVRQGKAKAKTEPFFKSWKKWIGKKVEVYGMINEGPILDGPPGPYLLLEKIRGLE
jgi:endonuclease YncB( thermonuclease family)